MSGIILFLTLAGYATACSDFFMGFTDPSLCLSGRTQDIGSTYNNTLTSWPVNYQGVSTHENPEYSFRWTSKYNTLGAFNICRSHVELICGLQVSLEIISETTNMAFRLSYLTELTTKDCHVPCWHLLAPSTRSPVPAR
jgi:hypothetical protein